VEIAKGVGAFNVTSDDEGDSRVAVTGGAGEAVAVDIAIGLAGGVTVCLQAERPPNATIVIRIKVMVLILITPPYQVSGVAIKAIIQTPITTYFAP